MSKTKTVFVLFPFSEPFKPIIQILLNTGLHLSVVQGWNKFMHSHVWTDLDFWSPRRIWKESKTNQQSHLSFRNSRGGSYLSEDILIDTLLKEKFKNNPGDLSWAAEEKIFSQYTLHFLLLSFQLILFVWRCKDKVWVKYLRYRKGDRHELEGTRTERWYEYSP